LEEQRKKEEEAAKEAKKHQKKDGILGFLMAQSDKKAEKGGLEFSMANLVIITNLSFYFYLWNMNQICNRRTELTFSSVLCTGSQRLSSC
jgi:hypothetical protein